MADDNRVVVKVTLDDGTVAKAFAKVENEGKSAFQNISETAAGVFAGDLLKAGLNSLKNTVVGLFSEAINSSAEFDLGLQKLNSALSISGKLTAGASQQYQDLASKIQRTTAFSDDTVVSVETLAATYSKTNAQALKLTQATIDFAAATGRDANEAALQLSQTLNGQIGRLGRLFPELKNFTASQLEAGAAVDYFAKRFAGSAQNQVDTFAGRVAQLKNNFDDFLKSIGQLITRSPAVLAIIQKISDTFASLSDSITKNAGGNDPFREIIIGFSYVASASIETGRLIGLNLALGFERAIQAYRAFNVIATLGLGDDTNQKLLDSNNRVRDLKNELATPGTASTFFDELIFKIGQTSGKLKQFVGEDLKKSLSVGDSATFFRGTIFDTLESLPFTMGQIMDATAEAFQNGVDKIVETSRQGIGQAATQAFQGFANSVSSGFAAIGKALVKGQNVFQAFAGALLSGIGQAAIQMGSFYILLGLARAFSTYGLDATAFELIGVGSALAVLGGTLSAFGEGVTGTSNPATSVSTGGGSAISTGDPTGTTSAAAMTQQTTPGVTVNIQGDVLDSRETGLRIIDLINEQFNSSGARVLAV